MPNQKTYKTSGFYQKVKLITNIFATCAAKTSLLRKSCHAKCNKKKTF